MYEGKTRGLKLSGSILQNTFLDYDNYNGLAQDFTLDFVNELSKRDRFILSDAFSRAEEPRSFDDAFGSTAGRYRIQKMNFLSATRAKSTPNTASRLAMVTPSMPIPGRTWLIPTLTAWASSLVIGKARSFPCQVDMTLHIDISTPAATL